MKKGLIVSIQGYTQETTQELASKLNKIEISGIRTDRPFKFKIPIIALEKIPEKKYYITPTVEAITRCQWGDYVAIDCRRGNPDLQLLLAYAQIHRIKVIADIKDYKDVDNIIRLHEKNNFDYPAYIATSFSFLDTNTINFKLIEYIKNNCEVPVIAEGKIKNADEAKICYDLGADNICVGSEISDIKYLAKKFIFNEGDFDK